MAAKVGQQRRLIQISEHDLQAGRLNLHGHLGLFPSDSFGGVEYSEKGKSLTLMISGLAANISTDIPIDKSTGDPEGSFRDTSWVQEFFRCNDVQCGSVVAIEKKGRFEICIETASEGESVSFRNGMKSKTRQSVKMRSKLLENWPTKAPVAERGYPIRSETGTPSISDVNWDQFRFIDLFAGIGGIRLGFEHHGGQCVFSSEWDEHAAITYEANFGHLPNGDITKIQPNDIPDHDLLLAGFPCQPFSIIGGQKGFGDTRGTLFFNVEEILRVKRPPAILLENVKQFKTHDKGRTYRTVMAKLHDLGYYTHTAILNAIHYGVPQKRERTFIVGFREDVPFQFPDPVMHPPTLDSVLEPDGEIDPKLIASEKIQLKRKTRLREQGKEPFYPSVWHENKGGNIGIHPFSCALRHNASYNYLLVNGKRRLSSRECLRLQGFPESFKIVLRHSLIRAQTGNSVAVPVIQAIAKQMMESLEGAKMGHLNKPELNLFGSVINGSC